MNRTAYFIFAILIAVGATSASAKKPPPPPQFVVVRKLPPEAVLQRVQAACIQDGMSIEQTTATQVTCSKPMDDSFRSMFFRALATPTYSTNPVVYQRVTAIRVGDSTTVSGEEFMRYQNAYGQETTIPINNRNTLTATGKGLQDMKVAWEARLAASGDDEAAALASANAALAARGGVIANQQAQPPSAPASSPAVADVNTHPLAPAAKHALAQVQCFDGFRLVGESAGKTLFEAKCSGGGTELVQCSGMDCKPLR